MSADLAKLLFNRTPDGVAIYEAVDEGADFIFVDFSPAAEKIEDVRREDVVGKRVTEVFPGVDDFGLLDVFKRVWATGTAEIFPMQLYMDDRIVGWRENYVSKLSDTGQIAVIYGNLTDFKGFFNSVFGFIGIYTKSGLLVHSNDAPLAAANLTRHDVIGKPFWETYWWSHSAAVRDQVRDALERAAKGEIVRDEFEVRVGDDETIVIDASFGPLRGEGGDFDRLFGYGVDISAQKEAEEALKESLKLFQDFASIGSDWFWEMDADLRYTYFSNNYEQHSGIPSEDAFGRTRAELYADILPEMTSDDLEQWEKFNRLVEARETFRDCETKWVRANGEVQHFVTSGKPIFDTDGKFKGYRGVGSNATKQKRVITELLESEERFRNLIEGSVQGVLIHANHKPLFANQAYAEIFGYDSYEEILAQESALDHVAPSYRDRLREYTKARIRGKNAPTTYEFEGVQKNGSSIWLENRVQVVNWEGHLAVQRSIIDITDRKKAEEVSGRLMAAIEGLSENFALYGPDEKMVLCNRNYRKLNEAIPEATRPGVSYEEHMRAIVDKGLAPTAMGREEEYIRERMERYRNPTGPYEVVRQNGIWLTNAQRAGGGSMAIIGTNITHLKRTEEAALEAQARLSGILEIAPEAVIAIGDDMNIRLFNKGAERIFGYKANEVLLGSLEILMPEYLRAGHRKHIEGFEGSGDTYRLMDQRQEILGLRKDGTEFPASASVSKLEIGGEKIYTVMLQDITERKHTYDTMMTAKSEAETATRAKSEFLAAMSHDLRTPLNAILGFADILTHQYFGPINDKYLEYADDIHSSGEHLLTLVNEILDLSTIEAGKQSLVKEELSTPEIVAECVRIIEEKARSLGIDLITKVPKSLSLLYADRRATKQILLNLLSNAIKFTPQGGKITVSTKTSKKNTTLKVADTGKGIPAEKLPKLTDPFARADADPYLAEQGWGLGLTITKSLVELHDGTLDIKSKVGKGTTVTVTFPNGTT